MKRFVFRVFVQKNRFLMDGCCCRDSVCKRKAMIGFQTGGCQEERLVRIPHNCDARLFYRCIAF